VAGVTGIEVELAVACGEDSIARAVFCTPAGISLGSSSAALLQVDEACLADRQEFLDLSEQGAFLVVDDSMEMQLTVGERHLDLDSLRADGVATEVAGGWRVEIPEGSNVEVTVGQTHMTLKCRPATDPALVVEAGGDAPNQVCGTCGADLNCIVDSKLALSPCARCGARNRVDGETPQAASPSSTGEGLQGDSGLASDVDGDTDGDHEVADQGGAGSPVAEPEDSAEEATEPGALSPARQEQPPLEVSVGGEAIEKLASASTELVSQLDESEASVAGEAIEKLASASTELVSQLDESEVSVAGEALDRLSSASTELMEQVEEVDPAEQRPRKRRRKRRRKERSPWTPRLVALLAVGLVSGAAGLAMIFYAVMIRAADG